MQNRSVPSDTVLIHATYRNPDSAVNWLTATLGFEEHYRYGNPTDGAQMRRGPLVVMVNRPVSERRSPLDAGGYTQSITIIVDDVDRLYRHVRDCGANVTEHLNVTMYGERQFVVVDPEGHPWLIAQHAEDIDPATWATMPE